MVLGYRSLIKIKITTKKTVKAGILACTAYLKRRQFLYFSLSEQFLAKVAMHQLFIFINYYYKRQFELEQHQNKQYYFQFQNVKNKTDCFLSSGNINFPPKESQNILFVNISIQFLIDNILNILKQQSSMQPLAEEQLSQCPPPATYFHLIQKVGDNGPYQRNVLLILLLNWYGAGMILIGTGFLFINNHYQCESHGIITNNCQNYICDHYSANDRGMFLQKTQINTLATQYGPYLCQNQWKLGMYKMSPYLGMFFGLAFFVFFIDNWGRKIAIIMSEIVKAVGLLILLCSLNIQMAVIGLFLAGAGCQTSVRIGISIVAQIMQSHKRQSSTILLQIAYGGSGIVIGIAYWIFKQWRIICLILQVIPCLLNLGLFFFYLEQTPAFLIRKGIKHAIERLNVIGKINKNEENLINQSDIKNVIDQQAKDQKNIHITVTPVDLCRYPSVRYPFLMTSVLFLCINITYFGPILIIQSFAFNIFVGQIVFSVSQVVAYPIAYHFLPRTKRRPFLMIFFAISTMLAVILLFLNEPQKCDWCKQAIIQLALIFALRFCIAYALGLYFVYIGQVFPMRIRGIAIGIGSTAGALSAAFGQVILHFLSSNAINPMFLFITVCIVALIVCFFLQETHGKELLDEIPEIQQKIKYQKIN